MTREERRDAGRFLKKHGMQRKEDSKGVGRRVGSAIAEKVKNRFHEAQERRRFNKTPEGKQLRNKHLKLEAEKQTLKTKIHKAKKQRQSSAFGGQTSHRGTSHPRRLKNNSRSRTFVEERYPDSGMGGDGLGNLLGSSGGGGRSHKPKKQSHSGFDSLF